MHFAGPQPFKRSFVRSHSFNAICEAQESHGFVELSQRTIWSQAYFQGEVTGLSSSCRAAASSCHS